MGKWLGIFLALFAVGCLVANPGARYKGYSGYTVHSTPQAKSFMPETYPVWIDKDFSPDQKAQIRLAVAEWTFALNGYRMYTVVTDDYDMDVAVLEHVTNTNQGMIVLALHEDQIQGKMKESSALAWVYNFEPIVHFAVDRLGTRDVKLIMLHEMGHTLGVRHLQVSGALMSDWYQDQVGCIDEVTARAVASANRELKWRWQNMNYCELGS